MRKCLIALVAVIAVAMVAAPAMADMKASGFYRSKAWLSNFDGRSGVPSVDDADKTAAFVEQRFRVKFDFGTENVKAVWYLESDMLFGDSSGSAPPGAAARNVGGALGGDKVQTETKNIYVWFKIPDTSVDMTWGLQAQKDAYQGVFYNADLAGIFLNGKYEPIGYTLGWAKLYEVANDTWDDATLYQAEVGWAPSKETKLGFNFYFLQDSTGKPGGQARLNPIVGGPAIDNYDLKLYMPGIDGSMKLGPVTLSGFFFWQTGTFEAVLPGEQDADVSAYSVDLRGDMALGPGKFFIEGIYLSGGDLSGDNPDYEAPITFGDFQNVPGTGPGGYSAYSRTRMQILLSSWDTINVSQCLIGCSGGVAGDSMGNSGRGLWHIAAGYSQKFGDKLSGEVNIGYMAAVDNLVDDDPNMGTDMGTEINAGVAYNVMKGLDVGVYGAWVFLGDFFKTSSGVTPEDPYAGYARVNYSF
jgi:hypothetical protein